MTNKKRIYTWLSVLVLYGIVAFMIAFTVYFTPTLIHLYHIG
jgi:hypothetical protein